MRYMRSLRGVVMAAVWLACVRERSALSGGDADSGGGFAPDAFFAGQDAAPDAYLPADLADGAAPLPRCTAEMVQRAALRPVPGELFVMHLGLGGFSMGEATLVQLPDGTKLAIDVGNNAHAAAVAAAVRQVFGADRLDVVLLTHHHADHEDGLSNLLDKLSVGRVVHRGFTDLTEAANNNTMRALCEAQARVPQIALCTNGRAGCTASAWEVPAPACAALPWSLGGGALRVLAANGITAAGDSYARAVGPLAAQDSNGENARSVLGMLAHGAFRYLFAGDLTGGGSDTDAVEAFYLDRLRADLEPVDVLHLSHHGRNTSSSEAWLSALLPPDGKPRNAVAGIASAHLRSPHASVVGDVTAHLSGGAMFVTRVASGGEELVGSAAFVNADGGDVRILTEGRGARYAVQAVSEAGAVIHTRAFQSASGCR